MHPKQILVVKEFYHNQDLFRGAVTIHVQSYSYLCGLAGYVVSKEGIAELKLVTCTIRGLMPLAVESSLGSWV